MTTRLRQRTHGVALKFDFVGSPFLQVSELECVVNMLQVHVFLHCPRKQLLFVGKFSHHVGLCRLVGELMKLSRQFAEFRLVHNTPLTSIMYPVCPALTADRRS